MMKFTTGNLLDSGAEALVNTVNTVGVMGKGIALMFKERFADNFQRYAAACKAKQVRTGQMFVTEVNELDGPRWIVNFPTKQHWRAPSQMTWVTEGLQDLRRFLIENKVKSVAIPPLGAGNGGLDWAAVREQIELALGDLTDIEITVFEPTRQYQNVAKRAGTEKLTPARADSRTGAPLLGVGHGMQPAGNPETGVVSGAGNRAICTGQSAESAICGT